MNANEREKNLKRGKKLNFKTNEISNIYHKIIIVLKANFENIPNTFLLILEPIGASNGRHYSYL
jgi:hypothetical protein